MFDLYLYLPHITWSKPSVDVSSLHGELVDGGLALGGSEYECIYLQSSCQISKYAVKIS